MIDKAEASRLVDEIADRVVALRGLIKAGADPNSHEDKAFTKDVIMVRTGIKRLQNRYFGKKL